MQKYRIKPCVNLSKNRKGMLNSYFTRKANIVFRNDTFPATVFGVRLMEDDCLKVPENCENIEEILTDEEKEELRESGLTFFKTDDSLFEAEFPVTEIVSVSGGQRYHLLDLSVKICINFYISDINIRIKARPLNLDQIPKHTIKAVSPFMNSYWYEGDTRYRSVCLGTYSGQIENVMRNSGLMFTELVQLITKIFKEYSDDSTPYFHPRQCYTIEDVAPSLPPLEVAPS